MKPAMASTSPQLAMLKRRAGLYLFITSAFLFLAWTYWHSPSRSVPPSKIITSPPSQSRPLSTDLSTAHAPFVAWPLARLCAETTFVPGLVFICDNNSGGPGNIRNYILTCLRYAIAAGATSLITPEITTRSADNLSQLFRERRPLSYMFDAAHFRAGLAAACPPMVLYDALEDVPHVAEKARRERLPDVDKMVERLSPKTLGGRRRGCDPRDPNRHTDRFGDAFRAHLNASAVERGFAPVGPESPRLMRVQWGALWDWDVFRDGPEVATTFGGLLRFREDVLVLGEAIVKALRREAGDLGGGVEQARRLLGIHLRTEEDALKEWPIYDTQASAYMREAERQGFSGGLGYLASGRESETRKFARDAQQEIQLRVRTKFDVLRGGELERLKSLTWDQQALVDFVVLLGTDYFLGVSPSSFSINVALKRHLQMEGLYTRPWKAGGKGDGRSWIVGKYESYWDDWLFMYDGMWP